MSVSRSTSTWSRTLRPPERLLQPRDELGAEDVDLAVQDAALVADLALLRLEVVLELLELFVGERAEIRERFHGHAAFPGVTDGFKRTPAQPSTST